MVGGGWLSVVGGWVIVDRMKISCPGPKGWKFSFNY